MFQTLAGVLEETEPESKFSQLVHDHLSPLLKEFERYFPTTKGPIELQKNGYATHL